MDSKQPTRLPGILQARILEWVAISFSNARVHAKLHQLCPTLCDPMDSSPPVSSVHRILQARILEWVAISFSRPYVRPLNKQVVENLRRLKLYQVSFLTTVVQNKKSITRRNWKFANTWKLNNTLLNNMDQEEIKGEIKYLDTKMETTYENLIAQQ